MRAGGKQKGGKYNHLRAMNDITHSSESTIVDSALTKILLEKQNTLES